MTNQQHPEVWWFLIQRHFWVCQVWVIWRITNRQHPGVWRFLIQQHFRVRWRITNRQHSEICRIKNRQTSGCCRFVIRQHWRIQGGVPGTCAPPGGPNSFIFMQFSAKNWKIIALLGVGAPPGKNPGSATGQITQTQTETETERIYYHEFTTWRVE